MSTKHFLLTSAVALLAFVTACSGDGTGPDPRRNPARINAVNLPALDDTIGAIMPEITVQVVDSAGRPVPGVEVQWTPGDAAARATPPANTTDAEGKARVSWQLGLTIPQQVLTARVAGVQPLEITARVRPGQPAQIVPSRPSLTLALLGEQQRLGGRVYDRGGNPVSAALRWTSADERIATVGPAPGMADSVVVTARRKGAAAITATTVEASFARASVTATVLPLDRIATANGITCALTETGDPYCWGENFAGALGDGTTTSRSTAAPVAGGLKLTTLSIGRLNVCGLAQGGAAYCWGFNGYGELGSGDTLNTHLTPVPVVGGHQFTSLSTGFGTTCALTAAGEAYCWGQNYQGELGRDTITSTCGTTATPRCSSVPIAVAGGLRFKSISAGTWDHVCAITTDGDAYCWGQNEFGQVSASASNSTCVFDTRCVRTPVPVPGGIKFTAIAAGFNFTCGLDAGGQAYCWGRGFGTDPAAGRVAPGLTFTAIDAGARSICGLTAAGEVYCWGDSYALGAAPLPYRVSSLSLGETFAGGATLRVCGNVRDEGAVCVSY